MSWGKIMDRFGTLKFKCGVEIQWYPDETNSEFHTFIRAKSNSELVGVHLLCSRERWHAEPDENTLFLSPGVELAYYLNVTGRMDDFFLDGAERCWSMGHDSRDTVASLIRIDGSIRCNDEGSLRIVSESNNLSALLL